MKFCEEFCYNYQYLEAVVILFGIKRLHMVVGLFTHFRWNATDQWIKLKVPKVVKQSKIQR